MVPKLEWNHLEGIQWHGIAYVSDYQVVCQRTSERALQCAGSLMKHCLDFKFNNF